jgi:patatin-like phospholipase/acyl hydrolase
MDGGGFRGIIITTFLEHLEKELNKTSHDLFDLFVGTSTGGFIASGITHRKLSATELNNKVYTPEIGKKMMSNSSLRNKISGMLYLSPKYDGVGKLEVIKSFGKNENEKFNKTDKHVLVTGFDITDQKPILFKSWKDSVHSIVTALDVTSAAPIFYPPVEYMFGKWAVDGGIYCNNPSMVAYVEAIKLFGKENDIRVLSIGTGYGKEPPMKKETEKWGVLKWVTKGEIFNLLMDTPMQNTTYNMEKLTKLLGHKYIRIQDHHVESSMDDVSEKNFKYLRSVGDKLWDKYGEEVIKFVVEDELKI